MHKITIEGVSNGWVVKVEYQTFVFKDKDKMLIEIGKYVGNLSDNQHQPAVNPRETSTDNSKTWMM